MAYEFELFRCPRGCPKPFWTVNELLTHHLDYHERSLPPLGWRPLVPPPPPGGVAPTALEIARMGLDAATVNGTRSHKD